MLRTVLLINITRIYEDSYNTNGTSYSFFNRRKLLLVNSISFNQNIVITLLPDRYVWENNILMTALIFSCDDVVLKIYLYQNSRVSTGGFELKNSCKQSSYRTH